MGREADGNGLSLLKKGQKGLRQVIFSRVGLITILFLAQVGLLLGALLRFNEFLPHIIGGSTVFAVGMVLYILNSKHDPTAKITWLVIIIIFPLFGAALYLYTESDIGHRAIKKHFSKLVSETQDKTPQSETASSGLYCKSPGASSLASYLYIRGGFCTYENTEVKYFPSGEAKFEELLIQLEKAEKFIFLEYFIIDEGFMWGKILEILARKAKEGVDVRVMYDGSCEFSTLPRDYPKRLKKLGIKCKVFSPITPFVSTYYNYRDHRKILVIDGHTAFTGGINFADEYINRVDRFGHWKDVAVMLRGEAAKSFTLMFLQMWNIFEKRFSIDKFLTYDRDDLDVKAEGYVIPYGDCPLDDDKVGERVYMDILNRAQNYVHIMSPYLILDGEMETAIKFAAERGVDISLILPGIPDKTLPYALAKTHYKSLLESGVKIYEYTPGFVHAKVFVCDDREAVVGTVNLDYRSLYHHFECAAYMYGVECISDIETDFQSTLKKCRRVTKETIKHEKKFMKLLGFIMKGFAPLM